MLGSLFGKREVWRFDPAGLRESADELMIPACGWYQLYTFRLEEEWEPEELKWSLDKRERLVLALVDIGGFQSRDFTEAALLNLKKILNFFRYYQKDVVLRLTYDTIGKGMEREPGTFRQIQRHMERLSEILRECPEVFVVQGMLLGSWGEMHTSRYLTKDRMEKLRKLLERFTGPETFLAVRTPAQYRMLHPESDAVETKMGLFDDAILGGDTHLGTFGRLPESTVGWEQPWSAEEELAFEKKTFRRVPIGGEAVWTEEREFTPTETVERLRTMGISYLNRCHDIRLLDRWKETIWKEDGVWNGVSLYDYIGRHLGHRFCIREVKWEALRCKKLLRLRIAVENVGFASCFQSAVLSLRWVRKNGTVSECILPGDVRGWESGGTGWIEGTIPLEECNVYLRMKRASDGRDIPFAVPGDDHGAFLGRLRLNEN